MPITENHDQAAIDAHNEKQRIRLHKYVDALCDDVESRAGFFGSLTVQVIWAGTRMKQWRSNLEQSINVDDKR
jgi:hypothetical protein